LGYLRLKPRHLGVSLLPADGSPLLPLPPPQKKRSPPSDSSPDTVTPGGMREFPDLAGPRIDPPQIARLVLPAAVPELALDPGDPVTKRLHSMLRRIAPVSGSI
jgi:hypothetical protein